MPKTCTYQVAADFINNKNKLLILSHENPDPDAYGSSLALSLALKKIGKEIVCANASGVIDDLSFLPAIDQIVSEIPKDNYDGVIVCDCSGPARLGKVYAQSLDSDQAILNIDHHISNEYFASSNLVLANCSSTSEIIFNLIQTLNIDLDLEIATLLLAGIYTDTGSLQYASVSPETFEVVANLIRAGANVEELCQKLFQNNPFNLMQLEAELVNNLKLEADGKYACVVVKPDLMTKYGVGHDSLHHIKDRFRQIEGVLVSALVRQEDNVWKVSLRSSDPIDVNQVAQALGGGGHKGAAGIKWNGELEELLSKLQSGVFEEINRHSK